MCDRNTTSAKVRRAVEMTRDRIHARVKQAERIDPCPTSENLGKAIHGVNVKSLMKRALKEVE